VDSLQKRVFGSAKQGAAFGRTKIASKSLTVRGLNSLTASVCTPIAAPVIATARLRGGNAASVRGAASLVVDAINTARAAGVTGLIVVRGDAAFYSSLPPAVATARTFGQLPDLAPRSAIASPKSTAPPGSQSSTRTLCSTSRPANGSRMPRSPKSPTPSSRLRQRTVTAGRLIVRRVRERNPRAHRKGELFATYGYHAVFTDSPFQLTQAESQHRGHALIRALGVLAHPGTPWPAAPQSAPN
jgi:hypothetical protein